MSNKNQLKKEYFYQKRKYKSALKDLAHCLPSEIESIGNDEIFEPGSAISSISVRLIESASALKALIQVINND